MFSARTTVVDLKKRYHLTKHLDVKNQSFKIKPTSVSVKSCANMWLNFRGS